jgi:hypothetical protein
MGYGQCSLGMCRWAGSVSRTTGSPRDQAVELRQGGGELNIVLPVSPAVDQSSQYPRGTDRAYIRVEVGRR